jgi:hypothetical protein
MGSCGDESGAAHRAETTATSMAILRSGTPRSNGAQGDAPYLLNTSYTLTADITVPEGGAESMIATSGGRFAGWVSTCSRASRCFAGTCLIWSGSSGKPRRRSAPGHHVIEFDFKYDGLGLGTLAFNSFAGIGKGGTGTLKVDGKVLDTKRMEKTIPMILQWDESFDIGSRLPRTDQSRKI